MNRISVAMATYNGARYLTEQLESLAAQTRPPLELHVGDDRSTDATEAIVRAFAERAPFPVHFVRNAERLGYGDNFVATARRCAGEWIAFCDQDDVWLPGKIEAIQREAAALPADVLLIVHPVRIAEEDLSQTGATMPAAPHRAVTGPLGRALFWSHLGCAMVFRRALAADLDPALRLPTMFTDIPRYPHDSWIAGIANVLGGIAETAEPLALYRRHQGTASEAGKHSGGAVLRDAAATGAGHYRHMAAVASEAAERLALLAAGCGRTAWRGRLKAGEAAFRAYGDAMETRAQIYGSRGALRRLGAVASLVRRGYFGLGPSSLGLKSAAKDVIAAAVPGMFRPSGEPR